jgi:hypothetical protein
MNAAKRQKSDMGKPISPELVRSSSIGTVPRPTTPMGKGHGIGVGKATAGKEGSEESKEGWSKERWHQAGLSYVLVILCGLVSELTKIQIS